MVSLRHNVDFVKLFLGRLTTNAGDSLYTTAAIWLVHDLAGSAFYTGLAGFLLFLPTALQFLAGPLVDRWSLRRTLSGTQAVQVPLVLLVPWAAWTGRLTVELVLVLVLVLATINQFVYPAQKTALPLIVADERLVDANSAFALAHRGVNLAFNAVGGVLVALVGAVTVYGLNSATFAITALLFASVAIPETESAGDPGGILEHVDAYAADIRAGVDFLRGTLLVRLMVAAVIGNFAMGVMTAALPAFADARGGPGLYGALMAAMGGGMLLGSLAASRIEVPFGRFVVVGFSAATVAWLGAVFVPWTPATVLLYAAAWTPFGAYDVFEETTIQLVVPDAVLGRVTTSATSLSMVTLPVGSLVGGVAVDAFGTRPVVAAVGGGLGLVAAYFLARPRLRTLPAVSAVDADDLGVQPLED